MNSNRSVKCLHCHQMFRPDVRNRRHQRYCSSKDCRRASKLASQRRDPGRTDCLRCTHGSVLALDAAQHPLPARCDPTTPDPDHGARQASLMERPGCGGFFIGKVRALNNVNQLLLRRIIGFSIQADNAGNPSSADLISINSSGQGVVADCFRHPSRLNHELVRDTYGRSNNDLTTRSAPINGITLSNTSSNTPCSAVAAFLPLRTRQSRVVTKQM